MIQDIMDAGKRDISEVYFLVRVGTWGEKELAEYIHDCIQEVNQDVATEVGQAWRDGYNEGRMDGMGNYPEERW